MRKYAPHRETYTSEDLNKAYAKLTPEEQYCINEARLTIGKLPGISERPGSPTALELLAAVGEWVNAHDPRVRGQRRPLVDTDYKV